MKKAIFEKTILAILTCALFMFNGCKSVPADPSEDPINPSALSVPVAKITDVTNRFKVNNADIDTLSKVISTKAEKIAISNPKIKEASQIKVDADKIGFINSDNIKNTVGLVEVREQLVKASSQVEDLKNENETLKSDLKHGMDKILLLTFSLCILGITAGVVLIFFNQQQNGIIAISVSITILGLVYFLQAYAWVLGIISGVFFLGLLGMCGYKIYQDQIVKKQLVLSFEKVKNAVQYTDAERNSVLNIQTDSTIKEVDKIKTELGITKK